MPRGGEGGAFLLDTNIVIALIALIARIALIAAEQAVVAALATASAVYVPAIVLGELFYGAQKSGRPAENAARVAALAASVAVLPCDVETAVQYGAVKAGLRARGTPIPENDVWIAALARQHGLTLVTRDRHFAHLPDLPRTAWE